MALLDTALLTVDQARDELREKSQLYDGIIERRLNALAGIFERETGWALKSRDLEAYRVDGSGKRDLYIPIVPVQEITQIDMRYEDETSYRTLTSPADDDEFILKNVKTGYVQLISDSFPCGKRNILLDMTVGFTSADYELAEAQRLLVMQLSFEYHRWQTNEAGVIAKSYSDGSISFAPQTHILREVLDGLTAMKNRQVA